MYGNKIPVLPEAVDRSVAFLAAFPQRTYSRHFCRPSLVPLVEINRLLGTEE